MIDRSPINQWTSIIMKYLRSTSKRDFVVIPIAVLTEQILSRRKLRFAGIPLMIWGYLQYRLAGSYRSRIGGGGPGISGPPPERLVTSGIYSVTRNPMYTGHVIFLSGLAISTSSPFAFAIAIGIVPWFGRRIVDDEKKMRELFGSDYDDYAAKVGRWGPGSALNTVLESAWSHLCHDTNER